MFPGMRDYSGNAGNTHQIFRFVQRPPPHIVLYDRVSKTRRAGLPASHAGIADVSSTRSSFCNGVDRTDYREPSYPRQTLRSVKTLSPR
jgi:hypothetical protein